VRFIACAARTYADSKGLPRTLEGLQQAPIITASVLGRQLRVAGLRDGVRQEVTLEPIIISEHFPFLRQAILAGLGVGLVPDYVVADSIATGEVVTCIDEWRLSIFGTAMFMMYMPNRRQTLAASTFISFVLERAAQERA
jgi:DNA-binding transcriptional LysR family regulator